MNYLIYCLRGILRLYHFTEKQSIETFINCNSIVNHFAPFSGYCTSLWTEKMDAMFHIPVTSLLIQIKNIVFFLILEQCFFYPPLYYCVLPMNKICVGGKRWFSTSYKSIILGLSVICAYTEQAGCCLLLLTCSFLQFII